MNDYMAVLILIGLFISPTLFFVYLNWDILK